ncbi:MAG: hypothetical protein LBJ89_00340 [Holosporales bacterium]|nr:hypothetical protein [Holosporales bacterium]
MEKVFSFLILNIVVAISAHSSVEIPRDKLIASDPARNLTLDSWIPADSSLFRHFPRDGAFVWMALTIFGKMESDIVENNAKRFKHGNSSDTLLIRLLTSRRMYVLKMCSKNELHAIRRIDPEFRNRTLYFNGIPFGSIFAPTHFFIRDAWVKTDEVNEVDLTNEVMTIQPYFHGTSNVFRFATPKQLEDWAQKLALVLCWASEHGVPLNDFHRDNYRYDLNEGRIGIFDLASGNRTNPITEIVHSWLMWIIDPLGRMLDKSSLKCADISAQALFLMNFINFSETNVDLINLHETAINFSATGEFLDHNLFVYFRFFGDAEYVNPPIGNEFKLFFEQIEREKNAQFFVQHHGLQKPMKSAERVAFESSFFDVADKISHCLHSIVRESKNEPGEYLFCPTVVAKNISDLGGQQFGEFMAYEVDSLFLPIWFLLKDCDIRHSRFIGPDFYLLKNLLKFAVRDKLNRQLNQMPIGKRAKEWNDIVEECNTDYISSHVPYGGTHYVDFVKVVPGTALKEPETLPS